jgi:GxxExxY protein
MNGDKRRLNGMTETIIGCAFRVANGLGVGFLEKVYENGLFHELRKAGLQVEQQKAIQVEYDGVIVGNYVADLLVEDEVLIELKVAKSINEIHLAQCLNYLPATGLNPPSSATSEPHASALSVSSTISNLRKSAVPFSSSTQETIHARSDHSTRPQLFLPSPGIRCRAA